VITEGEFKALAITQAYRDGKISIPAIAHPGLSYIRDEWAQALRSRGVSTVILAYDSGARPSKDGLLQLAPEEVWTIRHGQRLADAGLDVRALRLPLSPGQQKADLDSFILDHGAPRLQYLIDTAPSLRDYHRSLSRGLLAAANLPHPNAYPTRRPRPQRLQAAQELPAIARERPISLDEARATIAERVQNHALCGQGFLVLAHPPGTGKGHNTMRGLDAYRQAQSEPGQIVWTALRKEQIRDQQGLELVALHGRNPGNCHRYSEAQVLTQKGYSVREALCRRRCPHVSYCNYLQQFSQVADFFAPTPLLQATGWWKEAGVLVLDEFDPARLTRITSLTSADIAAMGRACDCPYARTILRWLTISLAAATDRRLSGGLLIAELDAVARGEGLNLATTLAAACDNLPPEDHQVMLPGFPQGAGLLEYEALPPNYSAIIISRLAHEQRLCVAGAQFTSRFELSEGRLTLFLRIDHLINQLAAPEQPKIILDATVHAQLLRHIFPDTPLHIERPTIAGGAQVVQVITRDWAKSTLRGDRRSIWYAEVAAQIRPNRPTLVVCTLECEDGLRASLGAAGHVQAVVTHYGALRGSNQYKGYDVILAQIYHPNLDAVIYQARALFADEAAPLDEQIITAERILTGADGAQWSVQVPTFRDGRLAALLENRREAEMVQCAMRGRPLDHPEAQITLLFGLPLPGLTPTVVREGGSSPESNIGRQEAVKHKLIEAARELLSAGTRTISVESLAEAASTSAGTVRKYWGYLADTLRLRASYQIRVEAPLSGRRFRTYQRMILSQRGRAVPQQPVPSTVQEAQAPEWGGTTDYARNEPHVTRVICGTRCIRRTSFRYRSFDQLRITGPP
jgi:hypothetical protein